MRNNRDSARKS